MIPIEALEAAEQAVIDAMIKYGPDGHIDGYQEIARAALEAAAPSVLAPLVTDLDKWAGRNKPGYYDEAQDDVVQILNPYRSQV